MAVISSCGTPIPVSVHRKTRIAPGVGSSPDSLVMVMTTDHFSVKTIAFPEQIEQDLVGAVGSPIEVAGHVVGDDDELKSFHWLRSANISLALSMSSERSKSMLSRSGRPDSTFDRSRMSLDQTQRGLPWRDERSGDYLRCSSVSGRVPEHTAMPMMAFIGVLISWLACWPEEVALGTIGDISGILRALQTLPTRCCRFFGSAVERAFERAGARFARVGGRSDGERRGGAFLTQCRW